MNRTSFLLSKAQLILLFLLVFLISCKHDEPTISTNNWQTIYQNKDLYLYSIKFLDKNNGYVLADSSAIHSTPNWRFILTTTDGGNHWVVNPYQFSAYDEVLVDIFPMGNGNILGIGYHVYKSSDNGKTWTDVSPQFVGSMNNDLHIIDSVTWLVASGNHIFRTNNAGQTWQTVFQTDFMGAFHHFSFPSPTVGYADIGVVDPDHGASVGLIVKTTDAGQTWTVLHPEPWKSNKESIPDMTYLQFVTDQIGYLLTIWDYKLYKTVDGGNHWVLVHNNTYSIGLAYFINENFGYYTDGVAVNVTNDGGKNWKVDYYNDAKDSDILTWTFLETGQGYALTRDQRIIKRN